jgi:hypothetical protein
MSSARNLLFVFALCLASQGVAQTVPQKAASAVDEDFVQKQFGPEFTLLPDLNPSIGDLDGDGVEDIVIPARAKSALIGEAEYNYKTLDPYTSYFGIGDPKITSEFATEDPKYRGFVLLVIHGAGPEAWRSDAAKAKFVIINLPFKEVAIKRIIWKKKKVYAIYAEETGADRMTSTLCFDGKSYKYQPMGASLQ